MYTNMAREDVTTYLITCSLSVPFDVLKKTFFGPRRQQFCVVCAEKCEFYGKRFFSRDEWRRRNISRHQRDREAFLACPFYHVVVFDEHRKLLFSYAKLDILDASFPRRHTTTLHIQWVLSPLFFPFFCLLTADIEEKSTARCSQPFESSEENGDKNLSSGLAAISTSFRASCDADSENFTKSRIYLSPKDFAQLSLPSSANRISLSIVTSQPLAEDYVKWLMAVKLIICCWKSISKHLMTARWKRQRKSG